jgi:hypothetical protein
MIKNFIKYIFIIAVLFTSNLPVFKNVAFSQEFERWNFVREIGPKLELPHGVTVTPDDCIWVAVFAGNEGEGIPGGAIVILNPDGSKKDVITGVSFQGTDYTFAPARGISTDCDGNVLYSSADVLYKIDYRTYGCLGRIVPMEDVSLTTAVSDKYGNIVVGFVVAVAGAGYLAYDSDLGFKRVVIDKSNVTNPSYTRDIAISPDGKYLYLSCISGTSVAQYYSENGTQGSYLFDKYIGTYGSGAETVQLDAKGRLWIGYGSSDIYGSGRYDCWDVEKNEIIGGFTSVENAITSSDGGFTMVRGLAFSNDGKKAYASVFEAAGILEWEYVAAPNITTPTTHAFGNVNVGTFLQKTLAITNNGSATLTISSLNITGGDASLFSLTPHMLPINIAPSGSIVLTIQFLPNSTGTKSAQLSIVHNATGSPSIVNLSGTGVTASTPSISLSTTALAFGYVTVNSSSEQIIRVTNSGTADLVISSFVISGGGFSFSSNQNSRTIAAGNYYDVPVKFSPSAAMGYIGTVTITHNATGSPSTINLSGTGVAPNITIGSNSLVFGDVTVNSSSEQIIRVTNSGTADLVISSFAINGGGFSFSSNQSSRTITAGNYYDVPVKFSPSAAMGYTGTVTITHNASGSSTTINLSGTGVTASAPSISLSTTALAFGDVTVNNSSEQTIRITNSGTASLVISSTNVVGVGFTLPNNETAITIVPGNSYNLIVKFLPIGAANYTGIVMLTHNADGSPTTINLSGIGVTTPDISFSTTSIAFGEVVIGSSPEQTVRITNSGTASLVISSTNVVGVGFTLRNNETAITIGPGNSYNLIIKFLPIAVANYTGIVILTHNANGSSATINLSGTGVYPSVPAITFDKTSLAFGNAIIGSLLQQSVRITNSGNADLIISSVTINGTGFTLPNGETSKTINAGSYYDLSVQFIPNTATNHNGTIILTHNASGSPTNIYLTGNGITSISVGELEDIFDTYNLSQNYPNPFNPITKIKYMIKESGFVSLQVHDVFGREIRQLVNGYQPSGNYEIEFNADNLPSGIYFYKLQSNKFSAIKKMVLIR